AHGALVAYDGGEVGRVVLDADVRREGAKAPRPLDGGHGREAYGDHVALAAASHAFTSSTNRVASSSLVPPTGRSCGVRSSTASACHSTAPGSRSVRRSASPWSSTRGRTGRLR